MFFDIVRKLADGAQIGFESVGDKGTIAVKAGRSKFSLQTIPETDFPDIATGDLSHSFSLAAKDLKRLIDKTQFAISTEETRYYLNGIYLHVVERDGTTLLRAVATDGHRLAQARWRPRSGRQACPASSCRARRSPRCRASPRRRTWR